MPQIPKILVERPNQLANHSYIKMTLVFEKTNVFVSAHLDSKRNEGLFSYEVWEALGKPTLTPSESRDKKCIGSIILEVRIQL